MLHHRWTSKALCQSAKARYKRSPYRLYLYKISGKHKCMEKKYMSGCLGLRVGREINCKWAWEFYWGSENVLKLINDDGCITTQIY